VKQAMRRMSLDDKTLTPRTVLGRSVGLRSYDRSAGVLPRIERPHQRACRALYEIYRKELLKNNALDFDDLLLETVRLLKASGETRERYNRVSATS